MPDPADSNLLEGPLPPRLIQLVPRFRPDADGLGECSLSLGDALLRQQGVPSDFVIWKPARPESELTVPAGPEFLHRIHRVRDQRPAELASILTKLGAETPQPVMLLHYTSYGFSNEGIAWWLPGLLRRFVAQGGRVVGFFHELYATGRFPTKTWLTSGLQRHIFRQLLALSAAGVTSNSDYLEQMRRENFSSRPLVQAGVCSNVGELADPLPVTGRPRRLAIFGQVLTRLRMYAQHLPELLRICDHLGIEEIADIGTHTGHRAELENYGKQAGSRFHLYGPLATEEVARLLAGSIAGAVNYSYGARFKSGIVGAYQAYGLPVILFNPTGEPQPADIDPACPIPARILAQPAGSAGLAALLEDAGRQGYTYYRAHRSYDSVLHQILPWMRLNRT